MAETNWNERALILLAQAQALMTTGDTWAIPPEHQGKADVWAHEVRELKAAYIDGTQLVFRSALAAMTAAAEQVCDSSPGAESWGPLCDAIDLAQEILDEEDIEKAREALAQREADEAQGDAEEAAVARAAPKGGS